MQIQERYADNLDQNVLLSFILGTETPIAILMLEVNFEGQLSTMAGAVSPDSAQKSGTILLALLYKGPVIIYYCFNRK